MTVQGTPGLLRVTKNEEKCTRYAKFDIAVNENH